MANDPNPLTAPAVTQAPRFAKEMTVGDALKAHPQVGMVFGSFHLGGCSHCSIPENQTLEQISASYGIPIEFLLQSLNSLPTK